MADLPKPSDLLKKGLPKPQDLLEKKNPIQNGSGIGTQTSLPGSKPFLPQVSTKIPSVLTPKGATEYQEQVKAFKPQKVQKQGEPKQPKPDGGGATAFMASLNTFNQGLFKTPRLLYDAASTVTDAALQALNLQQNESNYDDIVAASGYNSPLSVLDRLGDYYGGKANQYEKRQEKFNKGIIDSFTSGDYKSGGKQLWNNMAGSIPSMVGMALTGAAGNASKLSYVQKTMANALPFISQKNAELVEDESIPKPVRITNSILNAVSEVIFDQSFGTQAMIQSVIDVFKKEGREAAIDIAKNFTKGFAENAIKKIQPLTGSFKGAIEEMSTKLSQNIVDKYTINQDKDLTEGVLDAGLVGGVMTGGIGAIGKVAYSSSQKKNISQLMKQREELVNDLDNETLPDDIKLDISNKLDLIDNNITQIDDDLESVLLSLPEKQRLLLQDKESKILSIEQSLQDESLSDTTKDTLADKLLKEQESVDEILNKAVESRRDLIKNQIKDVLITPETSSNYANMTEDDKGNFVFFHVGNKGYETVKPGTGGSTVTSREEASALSKVGGLAMYYTDPNQVERQSASGAKYAVKIPKEKVYDFNTDKLNFIEEAKARHEAENPGKAFDTNSQLAYVTKIAGENGFDMVVAQWNNMTRAQTTKELTPADIQEYEGDVVKSKFTEEYESNKKKGFEPVVPVSKSERLAALYDKINKIRNKEKRYDDLYSLYADSGKLDQENITELINESDLPQDIKDEYKNILESKEEARRSQQTKPKEDAVQIKTTGEVPVQPEAKVGEEVVKGKPEPEAEITTEKGKQEEVIGNIKDAIITSEKTTNGVIYTITQNGTNFEIGTIGIADKSTPFYNQGNYYQIQKTKINDSFQQKGYATEAYKKIAESLDKPLISDKELTANAKKLWEKLVKDDVAEKYNKGYRILPVTQEKSPSQQIEQLRAKEQAELNNAIPNADKYKTDGKVDRSKITDAKDLKKFYEIYDKYDKLITPLLPSEIIINKSSIIKNSSKELNRVKSVDKKSEDGATFNIDGTKYEGVGLVVPVSSINTTVDKINPEMLADFVEKNKSKIGDKDTVKFGIYKFPNSNQVSIDLNIISPEKFKDKAIEFARLAGQESLFDLGIYENVKTGSDGKNPIDFTDTQFKEISKALKYGRIPDVFTKKELDTKQQIENFGVAKNQVESVNNVISQVFDNLKKARLTTAKNVSEWIGISKGVKSKEALKLEYGRFQKLGFEETDEYKKLKNNGYIIENFDIRSIGEKPIVIINPDNMITGKILSKEGKPILDANGGIHFVSKFGDVWASSDKATANTLAKYINTARENDIKNGDNGIVHIVVTKGSLGKSLTSHTGAKGSMAIIEYLVDKNMIPLKDFRSALISAGKIQGIDFNGKLDSKSIHEDIAKKFFGVNDSSFQGRGFFIRDVINHIAKNSKSVHDNIAEIRDALNSKEVGRKITFGEAGIRDAIGNLFADQMTQGVPNSHAYATIEISKPVEVVKGEHESYPFHIKQIGGERPKLNILFETSHIKDIATPREGSTNLGSNQIGMAEASIKSVADIDSLKQGINAQYRIESGKNIIEAIQDFNGSKKAVVAITHEIMHPTVVATIDGAKEGNEVGSRHTETIVSEFNKANPKNKVTVEQLIEWNDLFKGGKTDKQYRSVQEFIAKSWEKYHKEGGKGFSAQFQEVLNQITEAFKSVYKSISGKKLTPELRKMFDEILGKDLIKESKLNESNVENAIELLDEIEENKRKAERASSKRKADLEQKIAEAKSELDKIPDEAQIVKVINDNFDKIKKDLKEQGLLNVKC